MVNDEKDENDGSTESTMDDVISAWIFMLTIFGAILGSIEGYKWAGVLGAILGVVGGAVVGLIFGLLILPGLESRRF